MLRTSIARLCAWALVGLSLPWLSSFLNTDLRLDYLGEGGVIGPLIVLLLVVGLAGGLYPAFYLSLFQPATVLKANTSSTDPQGSGRFRNILVVAQFAVSIGLIIDRKSTRLNSSP